MKTKIRSIIVCLLFALILSAVCAPVFAETFTIGGTVPSVSIRNESDYLVFRNEVAEGKSFEGELVVLETNLDLSSGCEPIGDDTHRFEGTFDGRGYSVTYSIDGDGENVGFFGVIGEKATVRNFWAEGTVNGNKCVGGIVGVNYGTVENCYSFVTVSGVGEEPSSLGYIVGENNGCLKNSFAKYYSYEGATVGKDNGTQINVYNADTPTAESLAILNSACAENETYITWYWNWNGYPMLTREHGEHTFIFVDAVAPSCEYSGQKKGTVCSICGQHGTRMIVIPAIGSHTPVHIDEVPSTCAEEGKEGGEVCEVCGKVLSGFEPIAPAHGELVRVEEVPPTATEDGVSSGLVCSVCGEKIEGFDPIPATGEEETDDIGDESDENADEITKNTNDILNDNIDDNSEENTDGNNVGFVDSVIDWLKNIQITQDQFIFGTMAFGALILLLVAIVALANRKKYKK